MGGSADRREEALKRVSESGLGNNTLVSKEERKG